MNKLLKISATAALVVVAAMTTAVPADASVPKPTLLEEIPCC